MKCQTCGQEIESEDKCDKCSHYRREHYEWPDGEKGCRNLLCACKGFKK